MQQIERDALTIRIEGSAIALVGEVDITAAPAVVESFEIVREGGATSATVDCAALTYLDSSGISALLQGLQLLGASGAVRLVNVDPAVRRILDLLAIDQILDLEDPTGADRDDEAEPEPG